jgi:hypothetical protein
MTVNSVNQSASMASLAQLQKATAGGSEETQESQVERNRETVTQEENQQTPQAAGPLGGRIDVKG